MSDSSDLDRGTGRGVGKGLSKHSSKGVVFIYYTVQSESASQFAENKKFVPSKFL